VCSICLNRFKNRVTVIREIRCGHIFHPDCIDEFLHQVTSLCPICKASMLPKGYCPKITNEMVRRELAIRRLRHSARDGEDVGYNARKGRMHSALKNRRTNEPTVPTRPPKPRTSSFHHRSRSHQELQETTSSLARERMRALAGSSLEGRTGTPTTRCEQFR
jgi:hypothetical protein